MNDKLIKDLKVYTEGENSLEFVKLDPITVHLVLKRCAAILQSNGWMNAQHTPPPETGEEILCCDVNNYHPTTALFGTYHPNAAGKKCWRSPAGHKLYFTHWQPLLNKPTELS